MFLKHFAHSGLFFFLDFGKKGMGRGLRNGVLKVPLMEKEMALVLVQGGMGGGEEDQKKGVFLNKFTQLMMLFKWDIWACIWPMKMT